MIKYRSQNDGREVEFSDLSGVANSEPSLTIQSQRDDCDINVLMHRFGVTGQYPENPRIPQYGDFSHISDFRSALHAIRDAEDKFMEFPAETRAFFNNDPQLMVDFASNPANMEALKANQVDLNAQKSTGGGTPPQSSSPAQASGAGAQVSNGGVAVPK